VEIQIEHIHGMNVWQVGRELIQRADEIKISERFHIVKEHPIGKLANMPLFPAIAIPVETKRGFVCPEDHLECLKALLPETKKLIIIGWRGTEYQFLDLLKRSFKKRVPTLVVDANKETAKDTFKRIHAKVGNVTGDYADGGFSDFVASRHAERFLREN
jgi:hypothetical protein